MAERMALVIVTLVDEVLPEAGPTDDLLVPEGVSRLGSDEKPSDRRLMYSCSLWAELWDRLDMMNCFWLWRSLRYCDVLYCGVVCYAVLI